MVPKECLSSFLLLLISHRHNPIFQYNNSYLVYDLLRRAAAVFLTSFGLSLDEEEKRAIRPLRRRLLVCYLLVYNMDQSVSVAPSSSSSSFSSVSTSSSLRGSLLSSSSSTFEKTATIIVENVTRRLQEESFLDTEDGKAVVICFYLIAFIFGIPIIRLIYYRYVERIIDVAAAKARELSQRLSDRLSDAGRRVSDRMVTEKKISVSG